MLRGEGVEKKVDAREEESIQEIQVLTPAEGAPPPTPALPPAASVPLWGPCDTVARKLRAPELKASLYLRSNHCLLTSGPLSGFLVSVLRTHLLRTGLCRVLKAY